MTSEEFQRLVLEKLGNLEDKVGNIESKVENLTNEVGYIENKVGNLENVVGNLGHKLGSIEDKLGNLEDKVGSIEVKLVNLEHGQKIIKKDLESIIEQTADLSEFRYEINEKVDKLTEEFNTVEMITSKNWNEIARLKAAK